MSTNKEIFEQIVDSSVKHLRREGNSIVRANLERSRATIDAQLLGHPKIPSKGIRIILQNSSTGFNPEHSDVVAEYISRVYGANCTYQCQKTENISGVSHQSHMFRVQPYKAKRRS